MLWWLGLFACSQQALAGTTTLATTTPSRVPPTRAPATPTRKPLRTYHQKDLSDPGGYINYAYELLVKGDLGDRWIPNYAHSAAVTFPNGDKGALVSFGFFVRTGYLVLLRRRGSRLEPVQTLKSGWDYGTIAVDMTGRITGQISWEETGIEPVSLVRSRNGQPRQIFKVSGWNHSGTGLAVNGFDLLDVTDGRIDVIFTGDLEEMNWNEEGSYSTFKYVFLDLDDDRNKEIIQFARVCSVQVVEDRPGIDACLPMGRVHKYNDCEYAETMK